MQILTCLWLKTRFINMHGGQNLYCNDWSTFRIAVYTVTEPFSHQRSCDTSLTYTSVNAWKKTACYMVKISMASTLYCWFIFPVQSTWRDDTCINVQSLKIIIGDGIAVGYLCKINNEMEACKNFFKKFYVRKIVRLVILKKKMNKSITNWNWIT